jgi:hypothetical protein
MIIKTNKNNWKFIVTEINVDRNSGVNIDAIRKSNNGDVENISVLLTVVEMVAMANSINDMVSCYCKETNEDK